MPTNILQSVATYQESSLAYLQNLNCFIGTANTKFKNFQDLTGNLGTSVTFDLPPRMTTTASLTASFQDVEQRVHTLTCATPISSSFAFSNQEFIFNVKDYMDKFGKSATAEVGAQVEADVASASLAHTFRFYGDGTTAINSYNQLASAIAYFKNFGAAQGSLRGYLEDISASNIKSSGLSQFVPRRNDELVNSWDLGMYARAEWYESNLLPIHTAGNVGNDATVLTVTGVTTDADGGISAISFSGAGAGDADAIKANDLLQFSDAVVGQPNVRFLTFIGHKPSANPVQFRATADAASDGGGAVTISIYPKLYSAAGRNQNISEAIAAGMKVTALPSHRRGLITSGNPLYLAMPRMPEQDPFYTANKVDPDTGISLRLTYGSTFGQNQRGMIYDAIYGYTLVDEYAMAMIFPL